MFPEDPLMIETALSNLCPSNKVRGWIWTESNDWQPTTLPLCLQAPQISMSFFFLSVKCTLPFNHSYISKHYAYSYMNLQSIAKLGTYSLFMGQFNIINYLWLHTLYREWLSLYHFCRPDRQGKMIMNVFTRLSIYRGSRHKFPKFCTL